MLAPGGVYALVSFRSEALLRRLLQCDALPFEQMHHVPAAAPTLRLRVRVGVRVRVRVGVRVRVRVGVRVRVRLRVRVISSSYAAAAPTRGLLGDLGLAAADPCAP